MPKNSIKSVLKNADIQKVFELLEKEIGNGKTLKIQQNIINALQNEHKIEISIDDFIKEKVGLASKNFVRFINACVNEIEQLESKIGILFEQIDELSNAKVIDEVEKILYNLLKSEDFAKIDNENAYDRTIDLYLQFDEHFKNLHYTFEAKHTSGKLWQERKGIEEFDSKADFLSKAKYLKKAIGIITQKGFAEKFECSCGGLFEETFEDEKYFCGECGNFEKIANEKPIFQVSCEEIFIAIGESLQKIAKEFEELESFILNKKGFFQKEITPIGILKNLDLEIYFLHKQKHAQNFKKQNENSKTLTFTLDGSVSNFADYYISCGEILNDDGSIAFAKINMELFAVLYQISKKQGLEKNAAKFYVLHMLKSGNKKYQDSGGRKAFLQDMKNNFQIPNDYAEKLWNGFMK